MKAFLSWKCSWYHFSSSSGKYKFSNITSLMSVTFSLLSLKFFDAFWGCCDWSFVSWSSWGTWILFALKYAYSRTSNGLTKWHLLLILGAIMSTRPICGSRSTVGSYSRSIRIHLTVVIIRIHLTVLTISILTSINFRYKSSNWTKFIFLWTEIMVWSGTCNHGLSFISWMNHWLRKSLCRTMV